MRKSLAFLLGSALAVSSSCSNLDNQTAPYKNMNEMSEKYSLEGKGYLDLARKCEGVNLLREVPRDGFGDWNGFKEIVGEEYSVKSNTKNAKDMEFRVTVIHPETEFDLEQTTKLALGNQGYPKTAAFVQNGNLIVIYGDSKEEYGTSGYINFLLDFQDKIGNPIFQRLEYPEGKEYMQGSLQELRFDLIVSEDENHPSKE